MATLNRFPLLGLWAEEAARRIGYTKGEAEALGHAYAVLYAIRARGKPPDRQKPKPEKPPKKRFKGEQLRFGGDDLEVTYDTDGRVRGLVGWGPGGGGKRLRPRSFSGQASRPCPPTATTKS